MVSFAPAATGDADVVRDVDADAVHVTEAQWPATNAEKARLRPHVCAPRRRQAGTGAEGVAGDRVADCGGGVVRTGCGRTPVDPNARPPAAELVVAPDAPAPPADVPVS